MKKMPDPYWSLWGRIKAAARRLEAAHQNADDAYDTGQDKLGDLIMEDYRDEEGSRILPTVLPRRRVEIGGDEKRLCWIGADGRAKVKEVRNDAHAVATLRKLDADDSYWLSF